jgi:CBS domain containing-hemolysin-like protein
MLKLFTLISKKNLFAMLFVHVIVIIAMTLIITFAFDEDDFEGKQYSGFNTDNIIENVYFSIITISSIGYGDIYPKSLGARIFVSLMALYSILLYTAVI